LFPGNPAECQRESIGRQVCSGFVALPLCGQWFIGLVVHGLFRNASLAIPFPSPTNAPNPTATRLLGSPLKITPQRSVPERRRIHGANSDGNGTAIIKKAMKTNKQSSQSKQAPGLKIQSSNHQGNAEQQQPEARTARATFGAVTKQTFEALKAAAQWRGVFFHGPEPHKPTPEAEEIPTWIVYVGTKEGERVSRSYVCHSFERGAQLANVMAEDRGIELINEAQPA
jgi:hypothetical protein